VTGITFLSDVECCPVVSPPLMLGCVPIERKTLRRAPSDEVTRLRARDGKGTGNGE
jgi:hypothetical protein